MKANELMIGDWVVKPSGYIRTIGRAEFSNDDAWFEDTKPIPLTPEILEKNGFERRGGVSYHKSITGLIILHWNDDLCFLNYSKKNIPPIMIPFHYVHELQHALRFCGLHELADNFKV
ncbi:MAG: hypothetical protein MJZ12_00030 [Prevotella sp.]|nr:hypothetical protein [Prevotella sp.]